MRPWQHILFFLSEVRKMNFRVPYRSREILNVSHCFTLCISRPLCGPQKFILRPEDKKIVFMGCNSSGIDCTTKSLIGKRFLLILSISFTIKFFVQNQILLSNQKKMIILSIIALLRLQILFVEKSGECKIDVF